MTNGTPNATVSPLRPNWADTAKPFMGQMIRRLDNSISIASIGERLARLNPPRTPKDFLIDSCINVLGALTNNNWAVALFNDKLREDAMAHADELAELFGGYEAAIMGLIKQDLGAIQAVLK
jgi:hypothetical protein